jgi:hypothetical protein
MYTIDVPSEPNVPIDPASTESLELPMPSNPFGAQAVQLLDDANQTTWTPLGPKTLTQQIGDRIVKLFTTAQARLELKRAYRESQKRSRHYENLRA